MGKGTILANDLVAQYLDTLPLEDQPAIVVSAPESHPLRSIWPKFNGVGYVECLLDSGSQIISMSKQAAQKMQISYDPDICIHMQLANKQLGATLGLVKNVLTEISGIRLNL